MESNRYIGKSRLWTSENIEDKRGQREGNEELKMGSLQERVEEKENKLFDI